MERETKDVTIGVHKIVLKTYATARESQAIQNVYFSNTKLEVSGESYKINEFNPGVQTEVNKESVKQLVVSIDDKTDNLVETALDFRSEDFDKLIEEIQEITSKKK